MSGRPDLLLALDAGTGAGRAVLFDAVGSLVAGAYEEWGYRPVDGVPLAQEFDPAAMWQTFTRLCRGVLAKAEVSGAAVAGISTTSQRGGFVFLDARGEEIYGGPNLDQRPQLNPLFHDQAFLDRLVRLSGQGVRPARLITRLVWFAEARPGFFARVAGVLGLNDWLCYRLTGVRRAEPSQACFSGLFDVARGEWATELLEIFGLPPALFPPVSWAGEVQGEVTEEAARETGLRPGTPVVTGLGDTQAALVGSGTLEPGRVAAVAGTTAPLQMVTDRPVVDPTGLAWTACFTRPDRWVIEANCGLTGLGLRWLRDLLAEPDYGFVDQALDHIPPGSRGLLNYLGGRPASPYILAPGWLDEVAVHGADRTGRGELTRSLCEGIAYAARANLDRLASLTGRRPDRLVWSGGMAKNRRLAQLVASVLGLSVEVHPGEVSARGVAACAAAGLAVASGSAPGAVPDLTAAAERLRQPADLVEPDPALYRTYEPLYQTWLERYRRDTKN
jgi:autoinducer 2 (AI-2) kinase